MWLRESSQNPQCCLGHRRCPQVWHYGTVFRAFPLHPSERRRCKQPRRVMATRCLHSIKTTQEHIPLSIPDFQTLMRPLLEFASDGREHSLAEAREKLAQVFKLS